MDSVHAEIFAVPHSWQGTPQPVFDRPLDNDLKSNAFVQVQNFSAANDIHPICRFTGYMRSQPNNRMRDRQEPHRHWVDIPRTDSAYQ